MSEQLKTQSLPVTGKGSKPGPRWFVSKNPGLVIEVIAERHPDKDGNRAKFIRVSFKSEAKSDMHVGEGYLGSRNKLGTDTNSNRHYGMHFIIDPGPMPKDGYVSDEEPIEDENGVLHENWMRSAEEKADDRRIIEHFRKLYMYRHTPQDNTYLASGRLIELNWDPAEIRTYVGSIVIPGMGKPMARPPLLGSPEDAEAEKPALKAPRMGTVGLNRRAAQP